MINIAFAISVVELLGGKSCLEQNMGVTSIQAGESFVSFRFTKPAKNGANIMYVHDVGEGIDISFLFAPMVVATTVSRRSGLTMDQIRSYIEGETGFDLGRKEGSQ